MYKKFNINHYIKVQLTPLGLKMLKAQHDELKQYVTNLGEFVAPVVDEEGYTSFQMWSFMSTFGNSITLGSAELPFKTDTLIEIKDD